MGEAHIVLRVRPFKELGATLRRRKCNRKPTSVHQHPLASEFAYFFGNDDPIIRLVDGPTCPTVDVSSIDAKMNAYSLLVSKGPDRVADPRQRRITYVSGER